MDFITANDILVCNMIQQSAERKMMQLIELVRHLDLPSEKSETIENVYDQLNIYMSRLGYRLEKLGSEAEKELNNM